MDNNKLHATALCHVLQASSLPKYQSDISYIWGELYRLNSNLFVLERILQFRSDLFLEPMKMNFFNLVTISLTHDSCLVVTKLVTDSGGDTLTLSKFHNYVEQNILPEIKCAFNESCGKVDFKKTIQIVQDKIEPLRDNYLAHLIPQSQRLPQETGVAFQELRSICDQLISFFNLHTFGWQYGMLPIGYEPTIKSPSIDDQRPDIEYILDLIVQDSDQYKMPEINPYFREIQQILPPDRIRVINEYRKKFGKQAI